jgi:Domain of unknown function DUF1828
MNADDICRAFCRNIALHSVPIGYVLRTPFRRNDGDPLTVYIRRDETTPEERFRLEDDGQTIGFLETSGIDFDTDSRLSALAEILKEYDAHYDEENVLIHTGYFHTAEIPQACVRFSALLLRLNDLLLLAPGRIRHSFREDLIELAKQQFGEAAIHLNAALNPAMKDYPIDILVKSDDGRSLAIYAATSESKALEALLFTRECKDKHITNVRSMLVLENPKPQDIRNRTLSRVMNSDILLASMEGEAIAIKRKMEESLTFH